jgi:hypothetical protein
MAVAKGFGLALGIFSIVTIAIVEVATTLIIARALLRARRSANRSAKPS